VEEWRPLGRKAVLYRRRPSPNPLTPIVKEETRMARTTNDQRITRMVPNTNTVKQDHVASDDAVFSRLPGPRSGWEDWGMKREGT